MTSDKHILSYNSVATNKTMKGEYEIFTKTMIICALAKYYSYLKDLKILNLKKSIQIVLSFVQCLKVSCFWLTRKLIIGMSALTFMNML